MQGTIAQIIALTLEGNAALRGIASGGLEQTHSTMSFCEFVRFVDLTKTPTGWSERLVADEPSTWFQYLKDRGFISLRLTYGPSNDPNVDGNGVTDRMLVGFVGGGGRWLIQASKPGTSDHWEARWTVGDQQRTDRRIWRVTYGRIARSHPIEAAGQVDLRVIRERFHDVLVEIRAFAVKQDLAGFANCFAKGLDDLDSESPANGFHKELLNASLLPVSAIQLLSAAQSSWVFGGMGSWNDLGFDGQDQETYERLSEELYIVINRAIVAATNSSVGDPVHPVRQNVEDKAAKQQWWRIWG
jgi:hypothetical protein